MKIISTILMLLLTMSSVSYGATSDDVYVRKDVYEANMQGINAKLDMILEQMREFKEEQKAQRKDINELAKSVSVLSARVDGLDKRIDDLRNGIYLWLVAIGLVIAWPKLLEKFQNWGKSKPSVTLEDVKRLIEEHEMKLSGKPQV